MIEELLLNMGINAMKENFLALDDKTKQKEFCKLLDEKIELQQRKVKAIEYIKKHKRKDGFLNLNEWQTRDLLEILGDKE